MSQRASAKDKKLLTIAGLICVFLYTSQPMVDANPYTFYPSDEFDGNHLRPRWFVEHGNVRLEGGRLVLSNSEGQRAVLKLRSVWSQGTKIPLVWPWAMETHIVRSSQDRSQEAAATSGIWTEFIDAKGFKTVLTAGQGDGKIFYSIEGHEYTEPLGMLTGKSLDSLYVRLEAIGDDGQEVRIGFKLAEKDDWTFSPVKRLSHKMTHANGLGLMQESIASGQSVSAGFDYLRFEGKCFEFARTGKVRYVRDPVPKVTFTPIHGDYYEAHVPDTIDFAHRCGLALHTITAVTDPSADYEPYSHIYFNPEGWLGPNGAYNPDMERQPPVLVHDYHGYNTGIGEGMVETVPLLAMASGDLDKLGVGCKMFETMRRMIDTKGQTYSPLHGRPWALFLIWWVDDHLTGPWTKSGQYYAGEPWRTRALATLAAWHAVHPDPVIADEIRLMVDNLIRTGDIATTSTRGLLRAYQAIGYQPALDLALQHADQAMAMFGEDGSWKGHFHIHTQTLLALIDLATATNDKSRMEHVRKAYEFAKTKGWPIVGVFPEGTDSSPYPCETCELSEMIQLAILLTQAGAGDYWFDVDRWARNQLAEQQLIDTKWIQKLLDRIPQYHTPTPAGYPGTTDVLEKIVGSFSSYGSINEWSMFLPHSPGGAVGCCTGNGALALYTIWKNILTFSGGELRVNLLMNRASQWADVHSQIPYLGRVDIQVKQTVTLWVRMPKWVEKKDVTCQIDRKLKNLHWEQGYASPGRISAGKTVELSFPISTRQISTRIGEVDCTLTIKGNTVINVDPPGEICPIYQRKHYASDRTPFKIVKRFVPDREVNW